MDVLRVASGRSRRIAQQYDARVRLPIVDISWTQYSPQVFDLCGLLENCFAQQQMLSHVGYHSSTDCVLSGG